MKAEIIFLRSKVARRIFTLFILCALVPIAALAVVSFTHVTRQLNEQSRERLAQASKAQGMSIYERLRFVEAEMKMKMIASGLDVRSGSVPTASQAFPQDLEERFSGLALVTESGALQPLFRQIRGLPELTDAERTHVGAGRSVVSTSPPIRFRQAGVRAYGRRSAGTGGSAPARRGQQGISLGPRSPAGIDRAFRPG